MKPSGKAKTTGFHPIVYLLVFAALLLLVAAARYFSYLSNALASDVLTMNSAWPTILYYLSTFLDIAAMFAGYAFAIYCFLHFGFASCLLPSLLVILSTAASYYLSYRLYLLEYRNLVLTALRRSLFLNCGFEVIRFLAVLGITALVRLLFRDSGEGRPSEPCPRCGRALLFSALLVAVSRIVSELFSNTIPFLRTYDDVTKLEYIDIATTYLLILIFAALGYFAGRLTILLLSKADRTPRPASDTEKPISDPKN